ncbi:aldo/keto reductase [Fundicoccus culcitae]|uniref:Aldo/keto reductase n=1 Tax=Fundicoccus culcitae TaxID=2969821 RepID=A0ABY5P572_9LACT|nr:aldo/keto reductase [Fundicoccus culcitae]UUX33893.1 aldo/keto reductase [Fundicoccus culcitae]
MRVLQQTFTLANGVEIPKIGLGTWQMSPDEAYNSTKFALENGYLHVDTAVSYRNQQAVGKAVKDSGLDRDTVYITTKIPGEVKTYDEAKATIEQSLKELDVEYIDLILIHAPRPWQVMHDRPIENHYYEENANVWRAMVEAYEAGQLKAIGVSNFSIDDLEHLMATTTVAPHVNQVIYHIGRTNQELLAFCQNNHILLEGYSPIATGRLLDNQQIKAIADKYDKSIPQICIRYLLEKDILPLPKSVHEDYILQNADVDFSIEADDMAYLDSL